MFRYGMGILLAAGACAAVGVAACGDTIKETGIDAIHGNGSGGSSGGGNGTGATTSNGGGTWAPGDGCVGACCPTDLSCYASSDGAKAPGAECLSRVDNPASGGHVQLRQTYLHPITPKGNTISAVYSSLNLFTTLKEPLCNTPGGQSGYMQLIDFDLTDPDPTKNVATIGYATYIADTADAVKNGACFGVLDAWSDVYTNAGTKVTTDYSLKATDMSYSGDYPKGLLPPMPQPWKVTPTKAIRITKDFDLKAQSDNSAYAGKTVREEFLARLDPTGDLGQQGYTGVFFYDATTGKSHGFSPLAYQLIYDIGTNGKSLIVVPIREAETHSTFNDPQHPNCVGRYRAEALDSKNGCPASSDPTDPAWMGVTDTTLGEGDARIDGYFLITELEQIYSSVLGSTLCVSYPGYDVSKADGWASDSSKECRGSSKWNPSAQDQSGLPKGDWCAHTNDTGDDKCHDAYKSVSFHAFQGFKVKSGTCPALPQ